jgi:hypothetical protein
VIVDKNLVPPIKTNTNGYFKNYEEDLAQFSNNR